MPISATSAYRELPSLTHAGLRIATNRCRTKAFKHLTGLAFAVATSSAALAATEAAIDAAH